MRSNIDGVLINNEIKTGAIIISNLTNTIKAASHSLRGRVIRNLAWIFFFSASITYAETATISKNELFTAVEISDLQTIADYLSAGNDIDVLSKLGMTPLAIAVQSDDKQLINYLLSKDADVEFKDNNGWGLLHFAASADVVAKLIGAGVDLGDIDKDGNTALHTTSSKLAAEYLMELGLSINARNDMAQTPLHTSVALGNYRVVDFFIKQQADINARDQFGRTPLFYAERSRIVKRLLDAGIDAKARDSQDQCPLHVASDKEVASILIEAGLVVDARDKNGRTPLHTIAMSAEQNFDVAQLLVEKGAELDARDKDGRTPLHVVESRDVAEFLLSHGANLQLKDNEGKTPLQLATSNLNPEISMLFRRILGEKEANNQVAVNDQLPVIRNKNAETLQAKLDKAIALQRKTEVIEEQGEDFVGPPRPDINISMHISPKFEQVGKFFKGSAPAKMEGKWGLINTEGKWILAPTFSEVGDYSPEGILPVKATEKYGYVDYLGNPVTEFEFDGVQPFSEGLAAVKKGDFWGYIHSDSKWYRKPIYEAAGDFIEGIAKVKFVGWGYITTDTEVNNGVVHVTTLERAADFSEGHAVVRQDGFYGLINKKGETVIKPRFRRAGKLSEGLLAVSSSGGKWYYVDAEGNRAFNGSYDYAGAFSDGLAKVKKGKLWGYINKKNQVVIPFNYKSAEDFNNGVAIVTNMQKDRQFIDQTGRLISDDFDAILPVSEGYAAVKVDNNWGYVSVPNFSQDN